MMAFEIKMGELQRERDAAAELQARKDEAKRRAKERAARSLALLLASSFLACNSAAASLSLCNSPILISKAIICSSSLSCLRGNHDVPKRARIRKRNHPAPSLTETSRVDGVKAQKDAVYNTSLAFFSSVFPPLR